MRKIRQVIRFNDFGLISDMISILKAKVVHDTNKKLLHDKKIAAYISGFPPKKIYQPIVYNAISNQKNK